MEEKYTIGGAYNYDGKGGDYGTDSFNSDFEKKINGRIEDLKKEHPEWIDPVAEQNAEALQEAWKEILNNHDIGMAMNISDLEDVEKKGFQSFLENKKTNSSMGGSVMSKEGYAEYEAWAKKNGREPKPYSEFLNRPIENLTKMRTAHEKLIYGEVVNEKYGALIDKEIKSLADTGLMNYGNIVVKFKDTVRNNATWTMNDSLNYNSNAKRTPMIPSPIRQPNIASMGMQYKTTKSARVYPSKGDANMRMKDLHKKLKTNYVEIQLHGKLSAKDIDCIYIQKKDYNALSDGIKKKYKFVIVNAA